MHKLKVAPHSLQLLERVLLCSSTLTDSNQHTNTQEAGSTYNGVVAQRPVPLVSCSYIQQGHTQWLPSLLQIRKPFLVSHNLCLGVPISVQ